MGKKSGPPAPDYAGAAEKTAASQQEQLLQQTYANRANQVNPWGSQTWTAQKGIDPATGKPISNWTQTTSLDPSLQHALDSQLSLQSGRSDLANSLFPRAQQEFGDAMDWSGATPWARLPGSAQTRTTTNAFGFGGQGVQRGLDFSGLQDVEGSGAQRQKAEDAIYQSATSRLDPQWEKQQHDMQQNLANQGISVNSEAYSRAMQDFNQGKNDAYQQAQMAAVTGAGAEAQRNFGMDIGLRQQQAGEIGTQGQFGNQSQNQIYNQMLGQQNQAFQQNLGANQQNFSQNLQGAQFQNQMRQNQLAEMMQQRGFSLNEINAIISGQQVGMPSFQGYNQAGLGQGVDYSGAAQNQFSAGMQKQQMANDSTSGMLSGIGSIAGAAMMFSDRRVKRDIKRIGRHPRGFGIYRYRYIGERGSRVGVIAQEVQRFAPELVGSVRGVLQVNYSGL